VPVHLWSGVGDYSLQRLGSRQRNKVRKAQKRIQLVELAGPGLLREEGFSVAVSAHRRTNYGPPPTARRYHASVGAYFKRRRGMAIAGLVDGKLGGYMVGHAVDTTAYIGDVLLHSDHLKTNIGIALFHEWMLACRRTGGIDEVIHGQHAREAAGLCRHNESLGFVVTALPARAWFAPMTENAVRSRRPNTYYRLTGHD